MKKLYIILFLFVLPFILTGCNNSQNLNNAETNITTNRTGSTVSNNTVNTVENAINNTVSENNTVTENKVPQNTVTEAPAETVLYEFSTPIKSKSSNRLNNITITCSKLNGKTVEPNQEFSFCKTLGPATEAEGYKKADVIVDEKVVQALGGGNCQVSTTLYNAVLGVSSLEVTERHPHGKAVNYVPEGKDAAIAHGSKDLKFKNNSDKTIKIYSSTDGANVYVKLVSLN